MNIVSKLKSELREIADPQKAKLLQRFFKTGKGEYAEGDVFLGIMVPQSRKIVTKYKDLSLDSVEILLHSKFHEERLIALLILVDKFNRGIGLEKRQIYDFYLKNTNYINNWDLVDLSAPKIVGAFLSGSPRSLNDSSEPSGNTICRGPVGLHPRPTSSFASLGSGARRGPPAPATPLLLIKLARSENIWERRIAVLATFQFIKYGRFEQSLMLAKLLLNDQHDLIHKAVGWMLREIGKRDLRSEIGFLDQHYRQMPRTMLRYAIERFPEKLRKSYLRRELR